MWWVVGLGVVYCGLCGLALAMKCDEENHEPLCLRTFLLMLSPAGAVLGILFAVFGPIIAALAGIHWCWLWFSNRYNVHPGKYIHYPDSWPRPHAPAWLDNEIQVCRWHRRKEEG